MVLANTENFNNENINTENINEELEQHKNKLRGWQVFAFAAFFTAVLSLLGLWYVNNQKMFLLLDNHKLKLEAQNLKEEIAVLKGVNTTAANHNGNENQLPGQAGTSGQPTNHGYTTYQDKPGDSLGSISVAFFGTEIYAAQIAGLNGIKPESILQLGQSLKIPEKPER